MIKKDQIQLLVGIDDTDNAESRGTGYHSRQLAHLLETTGHVVVLGITRHQLFVDPAIRYTSQNSSACISIITDDPESITHTCEKYLQENSAPGSDAGLCISSEDKLSDAIRAWGNSAKDTILDMPGANSIARDAGIYLRGLTGNHEGIIGALAAIGLRSGGNDGRFIWRKGQKELREIKPGLFKVQELMNLLDLDAISSTEGVIPESQDNIFINEWVRPILKNHKAILIADKTYKADEYEWKLTSKEIIRSIS